MSRSASTTRTCRPRSKPTTLLALVLGGLSLITSAHAVLASTVEPRQERVLLAMMDEMGKGGAMGGIADSQRRTQMGGGVGGMNGVNSGGMGGMESMCCVGEMGKAPGAGTTMAIPSALPGFPGASHLYHVGAGGFFLAHADKLGLSVEQTTALNGIKQRALVEQSAAQRKIDEAEQALWMLTAADQPDVAAVEGKLREIEHLRSDQRLAFIRAVGEAAKVLNPDQRKMVLGIVPMPGTTPPKATTK